ncbi:MAG: DUF4243 domain-containing protein [Pelomonas sp.]|nr:DUF4243 domain-containing protein [Roseateles sp.]
MLPTAELHRRLERSLAYAPGYGPGYSNHLPMALHAAWQLGADAARLDAQLRHDGAWLAPAPAGEDAAPGDDWRALLGRREAYAALRARFAAEIGARGAEACLRDALPLLVSAPHAGLFHGMIRSAHALEAGHADELAAALASWALAWQPLPGGRADGVPLALDAWRAALDAQAAAPAQRLRGERLVDVARGPAYAGLCDALAPAAHWAVRREQLLGLALDAYLASGNFVVLHLITGLRALRVLGALVPEGPDVPVWLTRAFAAAWLAAGMTPRPRSGRPPPDWPALQRAALAQLDDHALKLTHACWQEDRLRADPRWREAAALGLGLA